MGSTSSRKLEEKLEAVRPSDDSRRAFQDSPFNQSRSPVQRACASDRYRFHNIVGGHAISLAPRIVNLPQVTSTQAIGISKCGPILVIAYFSNGIVVNGNPARYLLNPHWYSFAWSERRKVEFYGAPTVAEAGGILNPLCKRSFMFCFSPCFSPSLMR